MEAVQLQSSGTEMNYYPGMCSVSSLVCSLFTKSSDTKNVESEAKVYFKDTQLCFPTVSFSSAWRHLEIGIMARCTSPLQHSMAPWRKLWGHLNRVWVEGNSRGRSPPSQQVNSNSSEEHVPFINWYEWAVRKELCKLMDKKEMKHKAALQDSLSVYTSWNIRWSSSGTRVYFFKES